MVCPNDECPVLLLTGRRCEISVGENDCPRCGCLCDDTEILAPTPPARWEREAFVPVLEMADAAPALLIRALMIAAGIRHWVGDGWLPGRHKGVRSGPRPTLCVEPEKADDARRLLESLSTAVG